MLLGIQASQDVKLSNIARSLNEGIPLIKTEDRLSRNLKAKEWEGHLSERCFVEVRRRTRPMLCFVNPASVDRIIFATFRRFNEDWRSHTLRLFTHAA